MYRFIICALLAFGSSVDALHSGKVRSRDSRSSNVTDQAAKQRSTSCTPPASFMQLFPTTSQANLTAIAASSSYAVYGADDGDELTVFAYDCKEDKQLIFVHIPKNAGTTIEDVAAEGGIFWGRNQLPGRQLMPDGRWCTEWHVPPHLLTGYNPYASSNAEVFCVTRDPWKRIVSEYMYELGEGYTSPELPHLHDGPECTVEGFNTFVEGALTWVNAGYRYDYDCHLVPQSEYIEGPDGQQWCNHVLPITDLTDAFNGLMIEHGISLRMAPYDKANSARYQCPDLSSSSDVDLDGTFTELSKELMRHVYAKDFARIGDSLR